MDILDINTKKIKEFLNSYNGSLAEYTINEFIQSENFSQKSIILLYSQILNELIDKNWSQKSYDDFSKFCTTLLGLVELKISNKEILLDSENLFIIRTLSKLIVSKLFIIPNLLNIFNNCSLLYKNILNNNYPNTYENNINTINNFYVKTIEDFLKNLPEDKNYKPF